MRDSFAPVETLSHPARSGNEDVFGHRLSDRCLDIWIIDGATSVADQEYLGLNISDPAWFAQSLSQYFHDKASETILPPDTIRQALLDIKADYLHRTRGTEIPVYAQPLAALLWGRIRREDDGIHIAMWSMGDSRFLIRTAKGDTTLFPDIVRGDVTPIQSTQQTPVQNTESRSRNGVLTSRLDRIRSRRIQQHTIPEIAALGFHPDSVLHAEHQTMTFSPGFTLLGVTDGFYRLVDEYELYDDATLIGRASEKGLQVLYDVLRAHESEKDNPLAIKNKDDATAILFHFE